MHTRLDTLECAICVLNKKVQYYRNAYEVAERKGCLSNSQLYKSLTLKALNKLCELCAERSLLQLQLEPSTSQALDIIGADYLEYNGHIFITA